MARQRYGLEPYADLRIFQVSEAAVQAARAVQRAPHEHPRALLTRRIRAAVAVEVAAGRLKVLLGDEPRRPT